MEDKNLMQGLCEEIDRVKEIKKEYEAIPGGVFAATLMGIDIANAEKARNEGDVINMLCAYTALKEYEL